MKLFLMCRFPIRWDEVRENKVMGQEFIARTIQVVNKIRCRTKPAHDR